MSLLFLWFERNFLNFKFLVSCSYFLIQNELSIQFCFSCALDMLLYDNWEIWYFLCFHAFAPIERLISVKKISWKSFAFWHVWTPEEGWGTWSHASQLVFLKKSVIFGSLLRITTEGLKIVFLFMNSGKGFHKILLFASQFWTIKIFQFIWDWKKFLIQFALHTIVILGTVRALKKIIIMQQQSINFIDAVYNQTLMCHW